MRTLPAHLALLIALSLSAQTPDLWTTLKMQGTRAFEESRYSAAMENFEKALRLAEQDSGEGGRLAVSLSDLAEAYRTLGRWTTPRQAWNVPGSATVTPNFCARRSEQEATGSSRPEPHRLRTRAVSLAMLSDELIE